MRFKYKRKSYPAVKIGDVYYVRDEEFLKSECYKENQKLKTEIKKNKLNYISSTIKLHRALKERCEVLEKENKQFKIEIEHKNQLWKTAFKAYKKLKKKIETTLFPVEYIDFICATGIQIHPDEDRVVYDFSMPWCKVKEYLNKKYKNEIRPKIFGKDEELEELEEDDEL